MCIVLDTGIPGGRQDVGAKSRQGLSVEALPHAFGLVALLHVLDVSVEEEVVRSAHVRGQTVRQIVPSRR